MPQRRRPTPPKNRKPKPASAGLEQTPSPAGKKTAEDTNFPIVGIGASAGGLEAYTELLKHLPLDTGMAFVLVQHLDPVHESALTNLLAKATGMPVREAAHKLKVEPNHVYVIPPNTTLCIDRGVLKLLPRSKARAPHHSIDFFFESLAQDRRERAIGVILSGTASDGTVGLEAIKAEGGITFAQDESARYDSMPRSAVAAGCVDFVLAPKDIAKELARIARHPLVAGPAASYSTPEDDRASATAHADDATPLPSGGHGTPHTDARLAQTEAGRAATAADQGHKKILLLLRNHSGVDFSLYKSTTIQRRITRRMVLSRYHTLSDYADFLRGNAKELDALYSDVLISVTSFFRNPEAFEVLKRKVFPKLLKQRGDEPLRTWVLGCSTGQEAYSIAMSFTEVTDKVPRGHKLQIFATDLNEALLDKARHGLYAKTLAQDISPERLRRFFTEEQGGYRVNKALRDMVVFARQNLIGDPPFSRMDLISCRNLLIYLEPSLQKKAMPTFHYALKPEGFLFLGASESISGFSDLFAPADKKHKIFAKKPAPATLAPLPAKTERPSPGATRPPSPRVTGRGKVAAPLAAPDGFRTELSAQREADRVSVNQFAPPSVLINNELQVLQFRGPTAPWLQPPAGKASFNLLKMAREGLMLPLRAAINQARKENKTVRRENLRVADNGRTRRANVAVVPLKNLRERCYLVLFEHADKTPVDSSDLSFPRRRKSSGVTKALDPRLRGGDEKEKTPRRLKELETELAETRDFAQAIQEQHEAANEELQASNEEVQSANEELQSVNEELETSKEELESTNEELTTLNEELNHRNAELNRLNSDLTNLQTSTRLAIVLLGRDLAIRRFSAQAEKQFNLTAADLGRPFMHVRHNLLPPDLENLLGEVIASVRETEREVKDAAGRWFSLRARPYLTLDNKVDGAVLVLVDIAEQKRSQQAMAATRDYAEAVIRATRDPLLILNGDLRVHSANAAFYKTFQVTPAESGGRLVYDLGNRQWNIPRLRELLEGILPRKSAFDGFEVTHEFQKLGRRTMLLNARKLDDNTGQPVRILMGIQDVTERNNAERILRDADKRKDEFLAMLAHELRGPLAPLSNALEILQSAPSGGDETARHAQATAARQMRHLVRLVDDLMDASRISRGKLTLKRQRIELNSVLHQAVDAIEPAMAEARHELTVTLPEQPVWLLGDAVRLAQVLGNLLTNACKYTEPGGRIALTAEREGDCVAIAVKDNGIGIAADMLPQVFELFAQADQGLERTRGGLGIGLSLVQRLVKMQGGKVTAHSEGLGKGSEFVLRLPVLPEDAAQPAATSAAGGAPSAAAHISRRILVVDDNRDSAMSLAMMLKLGGHTTHTAHDGEEALAAAESFRPEVVLLDLGLPKISGYDTARKIREQPWGRDMVLIAVTGWGQDEDRRKSTEAGFDAHLVKPVNKSQLGKLLAGLPLVSNNAAGEN